MATTPKETSKKKSAATPKRTRKTMSDSAPTKARRTLSHDEIAQHARTLYEMSGYQGGRDVEFWLEAERQLREKKRL